MRPLQAILRPFLSRQFLVFLGVGGTCALVNFGAGALVRLISTSPTGYFASVAVGFTAGTVLSFVLNRRYTFAATDQPAKPQAIRFALASLLSIVLAAGVAEGLLKLVSLFAVGVMSPAQAESLAHLGSIGVVTIYSFLAIKFFAMRAPSPPS